MFGLGIPNLLVFFVIMLEVFGLVSLPEIGSGDGEAILGFKKNIRVPSEIKGIHKKDHHSDP